jgi:hypothetical protein
MNQEPSKENMEVHHHPDLHHKKKHLKKNGIFTSKPLPELSTDGSIEDE